VPIANYTTTVEAIKSVGEIQGILVGHGAKSIMTNYGDNGYVDSLSFLVDTPHGKLPFTLPVNPDAVLKVMRKDGLPPRYCNRVQANRVAWRILKDWVRAQMALLETEMVQIEEIFLPYMVAKDNKTLYQVMVERQFLLSQGQESG
jgi:hypothetical protein